MLSVGTLFVSPKLQAQTESSNGTDFADQAISGVCSAIHKTYEKIPFQVVRDNPKVIELMQEVDKCAQKSQGGGYDNSNYQQDKGMLDRILDYIKGVK